MTTQDISRYLHQPSKRYSGARMQKGRVILDSDYNEGEILDDEDQRVVVVDVVGRHGSSDRGFTIENVVDDDDDYEFDILTGSYYLGGMRHAIEGANPTLPQKFRAQTDWRQSNRTGVTLPPPLVVPVVERFDLAYLIGWEQPVSATEDNELLEQALLGRDTTARVRRMHRVYVRQNTADNCTDAFGGLVTALTTGGHVYDTTSGELKSGARLTVDFVESPEPADLCATPETTGYTGTENQAIRVQLIDEDRFLWSYDNASPLYRVSVTVEDNVVTVVFLTPPQKQEFFPLKDQVLEFLPWGAKLPTGEHVADHPIAADIGGGVYARVTASYNPRTRTLVASIVDQTTLENMLAWFDTELVAVDARYLYLRVWNPGDDAPEDEYGIPFDTDPVPLAGTGLELTFSQSGIVGDHWIIAARPSTPDIVVPWQLALGDAPHGPRRFYSPLAVMHWTPEVVGSEVEVVSCRRTFRGLTRLNGCCSVTVGDGVTSHGDYTSINEAVRALPIDEPGKVCILPGVYEELVLVDRRHDLVIEGCGDRTIIRTPSSNATSAGLLTVRQCVNLTLRGFKVEATGQFGVTVLGGVAADSTYAQRITLDTLTITTRRDATLDPPALDELTLSAASSAFPLSTIGAYGVARLRVVGCTLTMVGDLGPMANVLLNWCRSVVVRDCRILTPPGEGTVSKAWGGLHIAGNCVGVRVEGCEIREGLGHGITLGSVHVVLPPGPDDLTIGSGEPPTAPPDPGSWFAVDAGGDCPAVGNGLPFDSGEADEPSLVAPDLGPDDVAIHRNRIAEMSGSGISVLGFWGEAAGRPAQQITTNKVVIADNIIEDNYTHPAETPPDPELRAVVAFGGIVLADADDLHVRDNLIQRNGLNHQHPVCGVYVLHGENIVVENNQVLGNGPRVAGSALAGHRAGVALQLVGRLISVTDDGFLVDPDRALPAARVRGNVVHQPAGRALQVYGVGPMFVEGNVLIGEGLDGLTFAEREFAAHCVEIQNLGQSKELIDSEEIPSNLGIFPSPALHYDPAELDLRLLDGRIVFTDNQVRFNPVAGAAGEIFCATRIQSYGDVAVLDNQFFALFPASEGRMMQDTIVTAWSARVSHNRWEDPVDAIAGGPIATTVSAQTLAYMNITTLNQASRCIHVDIPAGAGSLANNPQALNQIYDALGCDPIPGFAEIMAPPP